MKYALLAAALAAVIPVAANASVVRADFRQELDLPKYSSGPRVHEANDRVIGAGPELTGDDLVSNPSGWFNYLNVDLEGDILTLTPDAGNSYQTISISLTDLIFDIVGQSLASVTLLSNGAVEEADLTFDWTASSLNINFVVQEGVESGHSFILVEGGVTQFRLNFANQQEVPEPAAIALLGMGLLGISGLRRRKA